MLTLDYKKVSYDNNSQPSHLAIKPDLDRMRNEAKYWVREELYREALELSQES